MIKKFMFFLLLLLGTGTFYFAFRPLNLSTQSVETESNRTATVLPLSPTVKAQKLKSLAKGDLGYLHPSVRFSNPGNLSTFDDPELSKAYGVYFSLIGSAKEQYPFAGSPFDTDHNSLLAYRTLRRTSYKPGEIPSRREFETAYLALSHLAHADSPKAASLRSRLISRWVSEIESALPSRTKALTELNLRGLLASMPESEANILPQLYRSSEDPFLRDGIALALNERLERQGLGDIEIRDYLLSEGMQRPRFVQIPHQGDKR